MGKSRIPAIAILVILLTACGLPSMGITQPTDTPTVSPSIPATMTKAPTQTKRPAATHLPPVTAWPMDPLGPIAYFQSANDDIRLIEGDGSHSLQLFSKAELGFDLNYVAGLAWSPDGMRLAVGTFGWSDIYILSVEGSTARNVTNTEEELETSPAWSPDGKRIVFRYHSWENGHQIRIMDVDGTQVQTLVVCSTTRCDNPAWSPSGEYIAYEYGSDIYVMKPDGSGKRKLISGGVNMYPAWSPDGQRIAFTRSVAEATTAYLYIANSDGTAPIPLTGDANNVGRLSWSPDGQYIVFENTMPTGLTGSLMILQVSSAVSRALVGGNCYAPAWRPGLITDPEDIHPLEDCTSGWTRLAAGGFAQVMGAAGDLPLRVRSEPIKGTNIIGQIAPGTIVQLIEGPVCADGLVFWKVSSSAIPGSSGWTAEGDGTEYWLEPYQP